MRNEDRPSPAPMQVAIVGGGVGGWTLFRFLQARGVDVRLYEQSARIGDVGGGIQISPNAAMLLDRIGLGDELARLATRVETAWELRRWSDGHVLAAQSLAGRSLLAPYYVVHRADLLTMLGAGEVDSVSLGARCVEVGQTSNRAWVRTEDGRRESADVVIGADGVHSIVRAAVTPSSQARFAGLVAHRAIVSGDQAPAEALRPVSTSWLGPGQHLVHYPLRDRTAVNLVAALPEENAAIESWSDRGSPEDFVARFAGWDEQLLALLDGVEEVGRYALVDREPLSTWTDGRLALLGDAAHPMLPTLAQGAGQTIEDAAVLAVCLAEGGRDRIEAALARYEHHRRPRATEVQQRSRRRPGELYHLPDGPAQRERDAAFAERDHAADNAWIWDFDVLEDVATSQALAMAAAA